MRIRLNVVQFPTKRTLPCSYTTQKCKSENIKPIAAIGDREKCIKLSKNDFRLCGCGKRDVFCFHFTFHRGDMWEISATTTTSHRIALKGSGKSEKSHTVTVESRRKTSQTFFSMKPNYARDYFNDVCGFTATHSAMMKLKFPLT